MQQTAYVSSAYAHFLQVQFCMDMECILTSEVIFFPLLKVRLLSPLQAAQIVRLTQGFGGLAIIAPLRK